MNGFVLREQFPFVAPNRLVWVKVGEVEVVGEVMSFPTEERTVFVRMVPGFASTAITVPVDDLSEVSADDYRKFARPAGGMVSFAVVNGRGSFPVDMLRYDSCWPFNFTLEEDDSGRVIPKLEEGHAELIVAKASRRPWTHDSLDDFTPARWASFLWGIKGLDKKQV